MPYFRHLLPEAAENQFSRRVVSMHARSRAPRNVEIQYTFLGRLGCWGINENEYSVQRNEGDVLVVLPHPLAAVGAKLPWHESK